MLWVYNLVLEGIFLVVLSMFMQDNRFRYYSSLQEHLKTKINIKFLLNFLASEDALKANSCIKDIENTVEIIFSQSYQ